MPSPVLKPPPLEASMEEWEAYANAKGCYCTVWKKNPDAYRAHGLEPGFCGICERCGKPGHTRHYPGPVPYTGAWCDRCYRIVGLTGWMRGPIGWGLIIAALVLGWHAVQRFLGP